MKVLGSDSKPLAAEGIDDKVVAYINTAFAGLAGQVGAAISASNKPVIESIASLDEKLTNLPAPKGDEKPAGEPKPGTPGDGDNAVLTSIVDSLAKLNERMDKSDSDTAAKNEASTSLKLTTDYFEKNHPTVKGKDVLIARIAGQKPKDDDEVKAMLDTQRTEMNAMMGEDQVTKMFAADAESEGAKGGKVDDDDAELKEKLDQLDSELPKAG